VGRRPVEAATPGSKKKLPAETHLLSAELGLDRYRSSKVAYVVGNAGQRVQAGLEMAGEGGGSAIMVGNGPLDRLPERLANEGERLLRKGEEIAARLRDPDGKA
jgi:hypothetical protein